MIFVDNQNHTDARINLAIEEHLLRNYMIDEEFLFYINGPSIIIGRNQNTIEEINQQYVEEHNIHVVRRLSGGGAVYHDLGNLNFSFISNSGHENIQNFKKFTAPVVKVLNEMGVPAELGGRNDILVEGRKVSGNAQYISGNRMVSHGTLLFKFRSFGRVRKSLKVKTNKIESKGIKSIRSRVANISEFMPERMDVFTFREKVKNGILAENQNTEYRLSDDDWISINQITQDRYQKWEWNFGRSPQFNVQKTERFPIGEIDARIEVEGGVIREIRFFGDYLGLSDVGEIEKRLVGSLFKKDSIEDALKDIDLRHFFGDLEKKELVRFIYQ